MHATGKRGSGVKLGWRRVEVAAHTSVGHIENLASWGLLERQKTAHVRARTSPIRGWSGTPELTDLG